VVETPSWHPKPQTVPPTTGKPATGSSSAAPLPAYTAEPEKKRGGIPMWGWAAGCIVLLCIGGVVALGGFGVLGSLLSGSTPTSEVIVAATATDETNVESPTPTPESADPAPTNTPPSVQPTSTEAFTRLPDTPTPPAVIPTGGGPIFFGTTRDGAVAQNETQEWTFNASVGDRIDVLVQPRDEDFDLIFDILNEEGISIVPGGQIDESFAAEQIQNLTIPVSGQYTIAVTGFDGTPGEYDVSLSISEAAPPGSTLLASDTLSSGAEHLFPFNSSAGNVTVVAIVDPEGDFDAILSIYDDSNDTLLEEVDNSFDRETLTFRLPSSGTYYFRVTGFGTSSGNYNISISGPPEITILLASRDEVQASFGNDAQLDYYFRGETGEIFTVSISTNDTIDMVIEIFEEGNLLTPLAEIDDNLTGEDEELTFTLPSDGLYIIRIREFFQDLGSFTLTIE
jgi:hypothetical protein